MSQNDRSYRWSSVSSAVEIPPTNVIIEGYLKKERKILISSKNFYRIIGKVMYMAPSHKKELKVKYDLTNY